MRALDFVFGQYSLAMDWQTAMRGYVTRDAQVGNRENRATYEEYMPEIMPEHHDNGGI